MSVSPDAVLLPPAPTAPQPLSPPIAAPAAAAPTGVSGANPGAAQEAPSAQAAGTGEPRSGSAVDRSAGRRSGAQKSPEASREARRAKAHTAGSEAQPRQPAGNFSQTLAQSLAAHAPPGGAPDVATGRGRPAAKSAAAHAPAKDKKSDPVESALALVSHGIAAASAPAPSAQPADTAAAQGATMSAPIGQGGAPAKALLAHPIAQDVKALAASSADSAAPSAHPAPQSSPSDIAAALGATPPGIGSTIAMRTAAAAAPATVLSASIGTSAWNEELGSRLTWMTHQGIQSASLQLSPEHLGPLQVSISVHHGQASVWFGAAHDETRQALERAMPQLRQMLLSQGLTLTDSGVSRDSPRDRAPQQGALNPIAAADAAPEGLSGPESVRVGLVDAYA